MIYKQHYSVLKKEIIDYLTTSTEDRKKLYIDMTFGAGGHSLALAASDRAFVLSVDQDDEAYNNGLELIKELDNAHLVKMNFVEFTQAFKNNEIPEVSDWKEVDGIVMDLGVSSHHFDESTRGFSFRFEGPLDMRMDQSRELTAEEIINEWHEDELLDIIQTFGEERFGKQIVRNIIEERSKNRIKTTKDLESIVFHSYPKKLRFSKIHPATKTFQAIRIAVNKELEVLEQAIFDAADILAPGGKMAIISFHSLEDRIVKHSFKKIAEKESQEKFFKILTKKPILPSSEELQENSRSRSAKLRVLQRGLDGEEKKGKKKNYKK